MKRISLIALMFVAAAGFASAQLVNSVSGDVLGAHLNYGRGCAACHAPHSGAYGNGNAKTADTTSGNRALWGEDVGSLYGQTIVTGQSSHAAAGVTEVLPTSFAATTPDVGGLLTCLSCHDGNYATGAMMKNQVYETLPSTYGTQAAIPTLLGRDGTGTGNYLNDHPVGLNATMTCGGTYDWDCTISATGSVQMTGTNSAQFVKNYGFFVSPGTYNATPIVLCTTCHNQHLMNVVKVTNGAKSGLTSGIYQTMFFVRAPYNPASGTAGSNQTAQFCRQCHGGEANEMNGSTTGTIF
ncbi:MAG: hypothetical protein P4L40_09675 [Terracidiphilus sp.]|nr:hypothetical protein [Terracidiphilus sp.]